MDQRQELARALAAAPVQRREFPVGFFGMPAAGQASVGNQDSGFRELDTTDPLARMLLRGGVGQTVDDTRRMWSQATDAAGWGAQLSPVRGVPLYKGQGASTGLNFRLREGRPLTADDRAIMEELEALMRPMDQQKVLWRGVSSGPYARAQPGDVLTDPGFMSTATDQSQARIFARPYPEAAIIGFRAPKGTVAADLSRFGESEVVLPRNQPWMVEEVLRRPDLPLPIVRMVAPQ